jgi:hypothetical protein
MRSESVRGPSRHLVRRSGLVASLIGRLGSSAFRLSSRWGVDVAHGLVLLFGIGAKALVWGFFSQEV